MSNPRVDVKGKLDHVRHMRIRMQPTLSSKYFSTNVPGCEQKLATMQDLEVTQCDKDTARCSRFGCDTHTELKIENNHPTESCK